MQLIRVIDKMGHYFFKLLTCCSIVFTLTLFLAPKVLAAPTSSPLCGNGTIDPGETCDLGDGKNTGEYGCNSECRDEAGWTCATGSTNVDSKIKEMVTMYKNLCASPYSNTECTTSTQLAQKDAISKCNDFAYHKEFLAFKAININNPLACDSACTSLTDSMNPKQTYNINCN